MLLDTHTLIWYLSDDPQLPRTIKEKISKHALVYVSVAVIWEIAIKGALGKLELNGKPIQTQQAVSDIIDACASLKFEMLDISAPHAVLAPFLISEHKDPFDRMLAAQSVQLGLPLCSADRAFDQMSPGVQRIWEEPPASQDSPAPHQRRPQGSVKRRTQ